jgi:hypothetical protein
MCPENLPNPAVRTPDRPARNELLCQPFFKLAQAYVRIYEFLFLLEGLTFVKAARRAARQLTVWSLECEVPSDVTEFSRSNSFLPLDFVF